MAAVRIAALREEVVFKLVPVIAVEAAHVAEVVSGRILPVLLTGVDGDEVAVTALAVYVARRVHVVGLDVVERSAALIAVVPRAVCEDFVLLRKLRTYMARTVASTARL